MPPVVSIENDLPGLNPSVSRPSFMSLTKTNPDIRQNGVNRIRVKIIASRMDGTSPALRKSLDIKNKQKERNKRT